MILLGLQEEVSNYLELARRILKGSQRRFKYLFDLRKRFLQGKGVYNSTRFYQFGFIGKNLLKRVVSYQVYPLGKGFHY